MPIKRAGSAVFTAAAHKIYQYSNDEFIEMRGSRSAMRAFHRIQRIHEKYYLLTDPEGFTEEFPFPDSPTFRKIAALFADIQRHLDAGWKADADKPEPPLLSVVDQELKILFLKIAHQRSWAFSAMICYPGTVSTRYRLPLSLMADEGFSVSESWMHGTFETLPFTDVQVHCHHVEQNDVQWTRYLNRKLGQTLPGLLASEHILEALEYSVPSVVHDH